MEHSKAERTILDVLAVWPCARAIFRHVPVRDLVRSERVSRDWQHAVQDHLRSCCLSLFHVNRDNEYIYPRKVLIPNLTISIPTAQHSLLHQTLMKLGSRIVTLSATPYNAYHLDVIASQCSHIRYIKLYNYGTGFTGYNLRIFQKLEQILLNDSIISDRDISQLLAAVCLKKIKIAISSVVGIFLQYIDTSNLRHLSLNRCPSLNINLMHSVAEKLHVLTSLRLDDNPMDVFNNVHLLLDKMPKLEELSLCNYRKTESNEKFIKSLSRLVNLKRLYMAKNLNVNNALLEALARSCQKLEYLDISEVGDRVHVKCARGVAALCRRPASGGTTLCLGYLSNATSAEVESAIRSTFLAMVLKKHGCVLELPPVRLKPGSGTSRRQTLPRELRSAGSSVQGVQLKIILSTYTDLRLIIGK